MDGVMFGGQSLAFCNDGSLYGRAAAFEADMIIVDTACKKASIAPQPESCEAAWWLALVTGTREYMAKNGFKQAVLGLSGGMDSALVAAVAVEAVGAKNVLGIIMPSPYTPQESINDAQNLAVDLGLRTKILPINQLMRSYDRVLAPLFAERQPDVTEENLQSRIRGTLLMAVSNKFGHILLTTGNKSELAVGYCTMYGDMNGALAVIGDLYKTEVYRLARWKNAQTGREIFSENMLSKAPSAELRPNQTDQDNLPPYEQLDNILRQLIEERLLPSAIQGDTATVARVLALVRGSEFKRKLAAPVITVSSRPFGSGWVMPMRFKFT
jgi:NAD+ synthetase